MYAKIENNTIVSYSKTKMDGGVYTTTAGLSGGMEVISINGDEIIAKVPDVIQKEINNNKIKSEKKEAIEKIASISDQLNLTAGTLDIVVDYIAKTNPEILLQPWVVESKEKLNEIKNILNK